MDTATVERLAREVGIGWLADPRDEFGDPEALMQFAAAVRAEALEEAAKAARPYGFRVAYAILALKP